MDINTHLNDYHGSEKEDSLPPAPVNQLDSSVKGPHFSSPAAMPRFFELESLDTLTNTFNKNNKEVMNMEQALRKSSEQGGDELYGPSGISAGTQKIVDQFS